MRMSTRRVGGVLLLITAVIGSLLVARVGGVRVAGSAVPVPGAGAPSVGDCVAEVTGPLTIPSQGAFPPPSMFVASLGEASVSFSDCVDEHVGEVVAYRRSPAPAAGATTGESDTEWCRNVAAGYQANTIWRFRGASGDDWQPATNQRFVAILSAAIEVPWVACAVLSPGLELYGGSYVESLSGRPAPAPFGLCRSGENPDRWVSCISPHRVQEFGVALQSGMSPRSAIADCAELIQEMTGLQDVNAGGVLRVQVVGGGSGDFGGSTESGTDEEADVGRCRLSVVAPHQLNGTLLGIGTHQLPLV